MIFLLFLFGAFLAFGLLMIFANVLKIPSLKTSKAVMTAGREDKKISRSQNGRGDPKALALNIIKGFMAVNLFTVVPSSFTASLLPCRAVCPVT